MNTASQEDADRALVAAVAAGDANAAARLVDAYATRLHGFAARMLADPDEAADVVQESFMRLWLHAKRWKPGKAKFSTWLFQVAANQCRDRLRQRRPHDPALLDQLIDHAPMAIEMLQRQQQDQQLQVAIAALPERQRAALLLCHVEGMGNIEAAAVLDVSVEALESLLGRARRRLRQSLVDPEPSQPELQRATP